MRHKICAKLSCPTPLIQFFENMHGLHIWLKTVYSQSQETGLHSQWKLYEKKAPIEKGSTHCLIAQYRNPYVQNYHLRLLIYNLLKYTSFAYLAQNSLPPSHSLRESHPFLPSLSNTHTNTLSLSLFLMLFSRSHDCYLSGLCLCVCVCFCAGPCAFMSL